MTSNRSFHGALLASSILAMASPALAAEVTPQRLANPEPQNWLMNHHTYDAQRFSPLDKINKGNVKGLKLAYAVAHRRHLHQREPAGDAARRGRLPLRRRPVGRGLQDRRPLRRHGPHRLAHGPRAGEGAARPIAAPRCGAISSSAPPTIRRASSRPTRRPARSPGRPTSTTSSSTCSSPPRRSRSRTRSSSAPPAATAACATSSPASTRKTGKLLWRKYTIPAPGEPGSETWKDKNNAWQTGGGAMWVTGILRSRHQPGDLGHRQSGADVRRQLPARRQPVHQQRDLVESRRRQDELVLPVHAGRPLGLRRGRHPHPDRRPDQRRGAQAHHPFGPQRLPLHDGAQQRADRWWRSPISRTSTGPRASTRRPASRSNTIPQADMQVYSGAATPVPGSLTKKMCPSPSGGNNYWPSAYSQKTKLLYMPALTPCVHAHAEFRAQQQEGRLEGRRATSRTSATRPTSSPPTRSPARSRSASTCPTRTTAARSRPRAASCSRASPTARSSPTTTPRSTSSGRSTSASASTRRP